MTKWYIKARSNSTLLTVDTAIENDFEKLTIIKKFNDVGTWALQLRKESPHYQTFLPVNKGYPNGILVHVDNEDGNGLQLVMSGPQTKINPKTQQDNTQTVLISGVSDEYWLLKRSTLQIPNFPYAGFWANSVSMERFYALNETSGTTATDLSPGATNGTYNGGFTLNQPGLIDDPSGCVLLNGTSGYVSSASTGLPTAANAPITFGAWIMFSANPASARFIMCIGDRDVAGKFINLNLQTSGAVQLSNGTISVTSLTALSLNTPHLVCGLYDGSNLFLWVDGVQLNNGSAASLTLAYSGATPFAIGSQTSGSLGALPGSFFPGDIGMAFFANAAFNTNPTNQIATMYLNGVNRQTFGSYDIPIVAMAPSPLTASTMLIYYVQRNASATASPYASYGACAPTTAFTNWQGTQSARQIPNLSIAADPLVGSSIYGIARQDKLVLLLASLALASNPEIGFKLEQSGSNLVFTVYQPADLTSTAIFARDLYGASGNILDYEWSLEAATANHIISGGTNPGTSLTSRLFGVGENAASISANGYLEEFLDHRQSAKSITLQQAISARLLEASAIFNVNVTTIDQPGVLYFKGPAGKGYDLGNKVTVLVDGQVFQQIIRAIQIDLQPGQPAVVKPAIGTPLNTEVINEYDTIAKRLDQVKQSNDSLSSYY